MKAARGGDLRVIDVPRHATFRLSRLRFAIVSAVVVTCQSSEPLLTIAIAHLACPLFRSLRRKALHRSGIRKPDTMEKKAIHFGCGNIGGSCTPVRLKLLSQLTVCPRSWIRCRVRSPHPSCFHPHVGPLTSCLADSSTSPDMK